MPDTELHDVEEEEKVFHVFQHSAKLAFAFGVINTPPTTPLHIFKNLQVCGDCHSATKLIAKASWEIHDSTRCQSLSSLSGWCLFL
jgi:hypothetical protein